MTGSLTITRDEMIGSRGYLANNSFPIDDEAKSAEVFEVISPAPFTSPSRIFTSRRRRRVSIEVHKTNKKNIEKYYLRFLDSRKSRKIKKEVASMLNIDVNSSIEYYSNDDRNLEWVEKYKFELRDVTIDKRIDFEHSCYLSIRLLNRKIQKRKIIFVSSSDATNFCEMVEQYHRRALCQVGKPSEETVLTLGKRQRKINILIEIVSASLSGLSNPFVNLELQGDFIHETAVLRNTCKPIWTVETNSLFLFRTEISKIDYSPLGIRFNVYSTNGTESNNVNGTNETESNAFIGFVRLTINDICWGEGKRQTYELKNVSNESKGSLILRFRLATKNDVEFMEKLEKGINFEEDGSKQSKTLHKLKNVLIAQKKTINGVIKYRSRPYPDPKRPVETEWLMKDSIEDEVLKDSEKWVDIGTADDIAKIFIEVLSCDLNKKTLNASESFNGTPSVLTSLVYEDSFVKTDKIDDCFSPSWLPWTQRAFIFHMTHPSSQIYLGVQDDDDLVGRVVIDLCNLIPHTEYLLHYDLIDHDSVSKGKVTIRLRIGCENERSLMLHSISKNKEIIPLNLKTEKEYHMVENLIYGKEVEYIKKNLNNHVKQMTNTVDQMKKKLKKSFLQVLLWRNSSELPCYFFSSQDPKYLKRQDIPVPLNSVISFFIGVTLVESPSLFPCFFFGLLAWFMIYTLNWRSNNSNPWRRNKKLNYLFRILLFGQSLPESIRQEADKLRESSNQQLDYRMDTRKSVSFSDLNNFKPILNILHVSFFHIDKCLRFLKDIFLWKDSYLSFLLTLTFAFLSFLFLFMKVGFIFIWLIRIIIWTLLGPWMKLFDIFLYNEKETTQMQKQDSQLLQERLLKNEAMRKILFGKYVAHVPTFKIDKESYIPLPNSSATPYRRLCTVAEVAIKQAGANKIRLTGQTLVGDMIPLPQQQPITDAPKGQPIKQNQYLEIQNDIRVLYRQESSVSASFKLGAVFLLALVLTWFAVPLLTKSIDLAFYFLSLHVNDLLYISRSLKFFFPQLKTALLYIFNFSNDTSNTPLQNMS